MTPAGDLLADLYTTGNYLEAGLWLIVGGACLIYALRSDTRQRGDATLAAVTFALFGLSDVVEVQTGHWARPWWLLAWKAACVATLLLLYVRHARRSKRR